MFFFKGRMIKIDGEIQLKALMWAKNGTFVINECFNRFNNLDEFFSGIQLLQTALHEQVNKRTCTAIHNRDFRGRHFNNQVINA